MIVIPEVQSATLVTHELAFDAMRRAFIEAIGADATSVPVVLGHGSDPQNRITIKSAAGADLAGLKVGAYFQPMMPAPCRAIRPGMRLRRWPGSVRCRASWCLAATRCAPMPLARCCKPRDCRLRQQTPKPPFAPPTSSSRPPPPPHHFLTPIGYGPAPYFVDGVGCTGQTGIAALSFPRARLFCDLPDRSARIGEFQHAAPETVLTAIGVVLIGAACGRQTDYEITIFDSSGISLQDLFMAKTILEAMVAANAT